MPDEKATNYWNMEVGSLVRLLRERKATGAPEEARPVAEEATSAEARLRIVPRDGYLDFYSTLNPRRLFSVQAGLTGPIAKFAQGEGAGGRRIVLTIPLGLPSGDRKQVKVTFHAPRAIEPGSSLEITRAGQGKLPPDTRLLEFLFSEGEHEFRYVVELDQRIDVLDFEEVVDRRPVFQSVPPVAQMTAFLRAITHQRRSALAILASLRSSASPQAEAGIVALQGLFRPHYEFAHPGVQGIQRLLERAGKTISPPVLHAFCLFLDLESGLLTPDRLEAESAQGALPLSPVALLMVAEYFGLRVSEHDWEDQFAGLGVSLREVRIQSSSSEVMLALDKLHSQRDQRTPVQILEQIALESNSRRASSFAQVLKERLPDGKLSLNDEQLALLALLSASGRKYQANSVVALCLFVDAEVGFLSEADLEQLTRSSETVDTSMYAMVAVAGAFDVQLRGLVIEEGEEADTPSLCALVEQSQAGLLAGFRMPDQTNHYWRWLRSADDARGALAGEMQFTRMVLGSFSILDQLSEPDLAQIAEAGHDLVANFQSDLDRALVWRRLSRISDKEWRSPAVDGRRTAFSFIEGFSAFHFSRMVMAALEKVEPEALLGRRNVVVVHLDNRENRHYRHLERVDSVEDLDPPPHSGHVWKGQVVRFPDVSRLPATMRELGQEALLGRSEPLSQELRQLEWIHDSLFGILTRLPEYSSLSAKPELLERVRKSLWSSQASAILTGLMDPKTRDGLSANLKGAAAYDFRLYKPMLEGGAGDEQLEFMGLRLMYEMCRSDVVSTEGYFKHYDASRFRSLIHNRLCEMVDSEDPKVRAMAIRLMATADEVPDRSARLVVEYELNRALSDPDPKVARAAAEGLVRLALMDVVPLPEMVELARIAVEEKPRKAVLQEPEIVEGAIPGMDLDEQRRIDAEIRRWVKDMKVVDARRAKGLPITDGEGEIVDKLLFPLVQVIAGLNTACRNDESLQKRRYFCVVPAQELESVRGAVLDSWKVMALSQGKRLSEVMAAASPAEVFLDYRFFVEDNAEALKRELGATPYFGGPEDPMTIYQFRPAELVSVFRRRESSFVSQVMEESRFFLDLLELSECEDPRTLRILRLSSAGGTSLAELESHLAVFTTERSLDPRTVEIFQLHRLRFAPLIHEMAFSQAQVGSEEEDLEDLQALLDLFQGKRYVPRTAGSREPSGEREAAPAPPPTMAQPPAPEPESERPPEPLPPPPPSGEALDAPPEPDRASVRDLAARLGRSFGLPEDLDRQIVNMLMAVGRSSLYDL